ncbi:MAG: heme lyase CcmF/NrfE family subunit, partial [Abitibacteriaceae bacterium]|nr:heme lyase CcmF/NrfE family subunit [Abditibacteriaceae bacterium]
MTANFGVSSLGRLFLILALIAAVYNIAATGAAYGVSEKKRVLFLDSAFNAALAVWGLLTAAALTLVYLFFADDFSINYVFEHSTKAQALPYKFSAFWGGQEGSLLMWAWILSTYALFVAFFWRRSKLEIVPTAVAIISVVSVFFIGLITFIANPFAHVAGAVPPDGRGLNPLLQNYWMQIHPPTLYAGYVGCTVPFSFAVAALLHRRFDNDWVGIVRRWTLIPWIVLTMGIIMGGAWAYETLGWGGYWAWDPVENASLMPWLVGTAFLHSIMIQARRGMLKAWNMTLVSLMFLLSVFGTFLTRSGVVSSIHSFAESGIGGYFLGFLALALVASFGLIIWRRDDLVSTAEFDSPISREGAFLLNNWILLGAAFAVLWGTVFPSISEAIVGQTVSVGKPYFNRVMVPLGLILLALTGVGPLMAWRRSSPRSMWKTFRMPILAALVASPLLWWLSSWQTGAGTAFCLSVFVVFAIVSEFVRGARARHSMTGESLGTGFVNLLLKNKQRYGGYIVHLGIVMMFVGITGSSAFKIEKDPITLQPGQTMQVGEYTLRFDGLLKPTDLPKDMEQQVAAGVAILRNGQPLTNSDGKPYQLLPMVDFYKPTGIMASEPRNGQDGQQARRPAIMSNLSNDLYLALTEFDAEKNTATIKAYLNPLVKWIWFSTAFFVGGTALAMWPERKRKRVASEVAAPGSA